MSLSFEAAKQGWWQLLTSPGSRNDNRSPLFGDNNGVAVGMLMLVPLLIALSRTGRSRAEQWLHRFLTVGVLYRAITTYSRGGFLAAGTLALAFMLRSPRKVRALAGAALAATLVLSAMPDRFWDRMNTIAAEEDARDRSSASRLYFWQVAVTMAQDRPLGVGVNAFQWAYDDYDVTKGLYLHRRAVHSTWFGMLAELGFGGLALFVASIALAWLACWRARRLARLGLVSQDLGHYASALEAALAVFAVGGTFVHIQYTEMLWHIVGLTMAVHFQTSEQMARSVEEKERAAATLRPAWTNVGAQPAAP
jgi:putative inorganic carbon (hco3(-)) transporter